MSQHNARRKGENQRVRPPSPGGRNDGFRAASLSDPTQFSNDGAGVGVRGEFNSQIGGEDTRGRQSAARGDNSTTKWRFDEEPNRNKTARERTQAPRKESARVRASHRLSEHSGALW